MSSVALLVYAAVITQALFVCVLLVTRPGDRTSNRLLAAPMLIVGVSAVHVVYLRAGWFETWPGWLLGIDTLPALYGPLFYLYARSVTGLGLGARPWLHALPFVAYTLYDLPRFALPGPEKLALALQETQTLATDQLVWQWGVELQGLAYLVAAQWLLHRRAPSMLSDASPTARRRQRWLRVFFATLLALWLGSMAARATALPILLYVHLGLSLLLYAIAYLNASAPELFGGNVSSASVSVGAAAAERTRPAAELATHAAGAQPGDGSEPAPAQRYRKARLEQEHAADIAARMTALFAAERLHLDPDFGLPSLATRLGVSAHQVSQVLNETLGKSFHDYINALRVDEVKERLLDPASAHQKVLAIGLECGFNSKSALNTNFKKALGMSPSEFRRQKLGSDAKA